MKILCLVDGPVIPPDRWMWNHLPDFAQDDIVDFAYVSGRDVSKKWGKLFTYYPPYLTLAVKVLYLCKRVKYDVIVGWESKLGFPLALLRSILGINDPKLVILAFQYKGLSEKFLWLGKLAVRGITHVTVLSPTEPEYYSKLIGLSAKQITVNPLGWHDMFASLPMVKENKSYVFASGRSCRDYKTFLTAVAEIDAQFIVNTQPFA